MKKLSLILAIVLLSATALAQVIEYRTDIEASDEIGQQYAYSIKESLAKSYKLVPHTEDGFTINVSCLPLKVEGVAPGSACGVQLTLYTKTGPASFMPYLVNSFVAIVRDPFDLGRKTAVKLDGGIDKVLKLLDKTPTKTEN